MAESPTPFAEIDLGPSKLDQFLDAHQKKLIMAAILLALGVIAYVIYDGIARGKAEDAGSALLVAESAEDYQKVIADWPESQSAASAMPLLAEVQSEKSATEAIQTLRDFISNNADYPALATAKVSLALRLLEQGESSEATNILTEVAESDTSTYIAPLAYITLGDIAKAAEDKEKASSFYIKAQEDPSGQGNAYTDLAVSRLALVNAAAPTKIKPAPPAPAPAPPAPAPLPTTTTDPATPTAATPTTATPGKPAQPAATDTPETPAEPSAEPNTPEASTEATETTAP